MTTVREPARLDPIEVRLRDNLAFARCHVVDGNLIAAPDPHREYNLVWIRAAPIRLGGIGETDREAARRPPGSRDDVELRSRFHRKHDLASVGGPARRRLGEL